MQVAGIVVARLLAGDRAEPLKRGRRSPIVAELVDQIQRGLQVLHRRGVVALQERHLARAHQDAGTARGRDPRGVCQQLFEPGAGLAVIPALVPERPQQTGEPRAIVDRFLR